MTPRSPTLGLAVQIRRQQLQLTQAQVAARIPIHASYIKSLEAGRRNATARIFLALARALDWTPSDLARAAGEYPRRSGP